MSTRVIIALGSNLGDRLARLRQARDLLSNLALMGEILQSGVYQTEPVLCPEDSPDFYNAVVSFDYAGSATELHGHTQAIETALGRSAVKQSNAPRVIDLDLLLFGDQTVDLADLTIPHPRLHLRRFVLQPLCEIHPELVIPGLLGSAAEQLLRLDSQEPPLQLVTNDW